MGVSEEKKKVGSYDGKHTSVEKFELEKLMITIAHKEFFYILQKMHKVIILLYAGHQSSR